MQAYCAVAELMLASAISVSSLARFGCSPTMAAFNDLSQRWQILPSPGHRALRLEGSQALEYVPQCSIIAHRP